MIEYKKEAPNFGDPNDPKTLEDYLALILSFAEGVGYEYPASGRQLEDYARKAWDLVPEENMKKYKKPEPKPYPDWGQSYTPKIPMTIEHWLANVLYSVHELIKYPSLRDEKHLNNIIHDARRAWDLVPEEKE